MNIEALGLLLFASHRTTTVDRAPNHIYQGGKVALKRLLIIGALAAASAFTFAMSAQAAGPNSGSCTTTKNGGATLAPVAPPAGVPNVYGQQTGTTSGDAGFDGSGGYLEAGGSTSGGYVSGANNGPVTAGPASAPASGLNGNLTISSTPGLCVGVAGKGGVNS
jgi:hypothetical protein